MGLFGDVIGIGGDIAGYFSSNEDREKARKYLEDARKGWEQLDPSVAAQETGPSAFGTADPTSRAAQLDALAQLRRQYTEGGLTAIDRGRVAEINAEAGNAGRTATAGAAADAARRGIGGGAALAATLQAGQGATQVAGRQGIDAAAMAEQARRGAVTGAGSLATGVRGQDYEKAAGLDAISRFNASQRQGAGYATQYGKLARQQGISGAYGSQAGQANSDAARTQGFWSGMGQAGGGVADYFTKKPPIPPEQLAL